MEDPVVARGEAARRGRSRPRPATATAAPRPAPDPRRSRARRGRSRSPSIDLLASAPTAADLSAAAASRERAAVWLHTAGDGDRLRHRERPAALLPLLRAYCDFYGASPSDDGLTAMARALIAAPDADGMLLVARDGDGAPIGFATVGWKWSSLRAARIAVMEDLFVAPEARGQGAADALIRACAERAREHRRPRPDLDDGARQPPRPGRLRARRRHRRHLAGVRAGAGLAGPSRRTGMDSGGSSGRSECWAHGYGLATRPARVAEDLCDSGIPCVVGMDV